MYTMYADLNCRWRDCDIIVITTMKLGTKKGWKSIMPLRLRGKSATRFCLFSKAKSSSSDPGNTPVYLNVYDLTPMNGYLYWAGLGIFHSGVEGRYAYSSYMHASFD